MINTTTERGHSRFLYDERGATSVLMLLMMITLVTLGTYSISSSQVNYVFCSKALEWNRRYLEADSKGEQFLQRLNQALAEAERKTIIAAVSPSYAAYDTSPKQALSNLYMTNAREEIAKLSDPSVTLNGSTLTADACSDNCHISIVAELAPLRFSFDPSGAATTNNEPRYTVLKWEQWQETSASIFQQPVWDGLVTE
ncbi:MAG: hypothetical protein LBL96_04955 [Clostridiales bacterium]|jgi:hypothetical protein|nr:hypothetical protein [Clostridiales bacterium]